MKSLIKTKKEYEGRWLVWNTKTGDVADIFITDDMFMGHYKTLYTVVYRGERVGVMIEHFQAAKSIARKHLVA
jgi:hypothetical protein